jgi:hypothetical protein
MGGPRGPRGGNLSQEEVSVGASSPATSDSSVDLPLPDGPVTAMNCPAGTNRSTASRMVSFSVPLATVLVTARGGSSAPAPPDQDDGGLSLARRRW